MSETAKKQAAEAALELVQDGMTVGLGTGSTAKYFIEGLGEKARRGMEVLGVPTSKATEALARQAGVPIVIPDETTLIDIDVDGADEVTVDGSMIKGGGGALLREKIVARAATKFILIADASKRVEVLGRFPLPVEIESFGFGLTLRALRQVLSDHGFESPKIELRPSSDRRGFFESDGGHLIADLHLQRIEEPEALDHALSLVPGVITTGLFLGLHPRQILATEDGLLHE
ncbi:MAG: ribose-5-phosphate isomerase RpiA [Parvularcula sp.]|jgi:ribose 5-phosphate isomerase A|nr:ribose-5-phosphate isomerase RpiA [Parvularcula sp.]